MNKTPFLIVLLISSFYNILFAQQNIGEEIKKIIFHADSLFWQNYNVCNVEGMLSFCADDIEFYHDKGGLTVGLAAFGESLKNGLCGKVGWRLRREAVASTVNVYPLGNYGGIISGEHLFYVIEDGKPEYLDGRALFTQLWLLKEGEWKMARVFSYDHGPATYKSNRKDISLSDSVMNAYQGAYDGANIKNIQVYTQGHRLHIRTGHKEFLPLAESETVFFLTDRDLQFEFIKSKGMATKLVVWEKGIKVEEAVKVK